MAGGASSYNFFAMRHRSFPLDLAAIIATALAIVGSLWFPDLIDAGKYYVLGLVMLTVGIPHGAVDHIISAKLYNLSNSLKDQITFYIPYLALMLLMGIIWYLSPKVGFLIFIGCTVYHFGQADLIYLALPSTLKNILYLSRGFMIMGLLIFIHPSTTFPIMETIAGFTLSESTFWSNYPLLIGAIMAIQHLVFVGVAVFFYRSKASIEPWYILGDSLLITALFTFTEPITAFAIYFACWHSIGHIKELISFFQTEDTDWSLITFYKHSWLFTLISFLGLALLYWINQAFGSDLQMLAMLLILISVLTLPHMLVVEVLFKNNNPATS